MKEVIYPTLEHNKPNTSVGCPNCGGSMRYDSIPCPDGKVGCVVIHNGHRCLDCGKIFI